MRDLQVVSVSGSSARAPREIKISNWRRLMRQSAAQFGRCIVLRIAAIRQASGQSRGKSETPLHVVRRKNAAIRRQKAAVEGDAQLLAANRWQSKTAELPTAGVVLRDRGTVVNKGGYSPLTSTRWAHPKPTQRARENPGFSHPIDRCATGPQRKPTKERR